MTQVTHNDQGLTSGNPAFSEKVAQSYLVADPTQAKPRTMTVAGTSVKTLVLLIVLVAGGAWGWVSATEPVATDTGSGYGNTTVTIPGGFWLASFGALFVGIFLVLNPRKAPKLKASLGLPSYRRCVSSWSHSCCTSQGSSDPHNAWHLGSLPPWAACACSI